MIKIAMVVVGDCPMASNESVVGVSVNVDCIVDKLVDKSDCAACGNGLVRDGGVASMLCRLLIAS
jgi:hypothetical protein